MDIAQRAAALTPYWSVIMPSIRVLSSTERAIRMSTRMRKLAVTIVCFVLLAAPGSECCRAADEPRRPNVVFILTDNQGAWTLGCYGNADIETPHLDRMAAEGVLFSRSYSSNAVCSPTRATYLTGLIPSQHGVHRYLSGEGVQMGPHAYSTMADYRTLPEILSGAGYICGLVGKWHLGDSLRPQEGFTTWVTKPRGHTSTFVNDEIIEGGKVRKEPTYATDYWTDRAVEFISTNHQRPFFLMLSYNGPYGLHDLMLQKAPDRYRRRYEGRPMVSFPRRPPDPRLKANINLMNNIEAMRNLAAHVTAVDAGVGRVLAELKRLGLDDDTLVVFTADQGAAAGHSGFWGMGDHTRPLTAFDWTMHVPLIFRHLGRIPPGQRSNVMVSNYDFLPSVLGYLGLANRVAESPPSPGRDYSPVLRSKTPETWDNTIFYEFENVRAIRTERYKYVMRFREQPNELYDLAADPGELRNLIDDERHRETIAALRPRLEKFFARYAEPKWDLWRGGKSRSRLITAPLFGERLSLPMAGDGEVKK